GLPKVMVSTMASGNVAPYVDVKDVTMMYSVVDVAGLNRLSRRILANAAGAVAGMVEQAAPAGEDKPLITATMFGVTTPCVTAVRQALEAKGFEVLVFHATGSGGRAMESLIEGGFIAGVADITTTEWCDELVGGVLSAGPHRLEAAARKGVPQVVSLGALDMVNFGALETVPEAFKARTLYKHNPTVTLMRTTPAECAQLGKIIAEKLNAATGPTALFVPLKGVSMIDAAGQPFYSPEADAALFAALRQHLDRAKVELIELDLHVNDPAFAAAMADRLLAMLGR
ncbi:MAG: Tm-1-like ATP-binding domain-containing protein, partial [Anaerolineales bacterium]|nr:Tm-1-like ATP-binding domain-containing protein [Anaerolineales bacterium]